ncbi:hypothetical protein CY34DRAFT_812646 [Suillus luteus UH-Slu-Lm8-n1]|uniref:Uncharacterized protein n=1 Tax=Suillus luteus UH-Slu-Lm8-n1 TaxID=930992 RepID=A0A0C9ZBB6_9AGAM|nr:hypothetical protein CY34DRAFT_812646 [Suillus luteus UH-Slu-Lm8-n1]
MPPFSRTPVEPLRSRTEASSSGSEWFTRRHLRKNLPLPQRENTNEWNSHADAILVDPDWIMRSPSPIELYAPTHFDYGAIYSNFDPTCDLQQYEDTDIVMGSPSRPTRSSTPEQTHFTSLESCWDDDSEAPRSTTPAVEDSKPWGSSPWAETDASKFESTEESWGSDASKFESTEDSWGADATKDEPSEGSSRGTKASRSSTTAALEDAWDSFSW